MSITMVDNSLLVPNYTKETFRKLLGEYPNYPQELVRILSNSCTNFSQLITVRHVDSCAQKDFSGFDVQIVARPHQSLWPSAQDGMHRDVGLVRFLVLAKSDVSVDSEDRALWVKLKLGRKSCEVRLKANDKRLHRQLDARFKLALVPLKPAPIIVLPKGPEKPHALRREAAEWWVKGRFVDQPVCFF